MSRPDRPMFIVTVGRSGSTLLHGILCRHPSVAWLSDFDDRFPDWPFPTKALTRFRDVPVIGLRMSTRHGPRECWDFWEHHCPGFSVPGRDLLESDVTPEAERRLPTALQARTTRRRSRILIKITGWPRIRFLSEVFPDALFIHLVRDGRAVAGSLIEQPWWTGRDGPDRWNWGELPHRYRAQWERSRKSPVELAAIAWEMALDAIEDCKRAIDPGRLLEVRYEDLCREPDARVREILEFSNLDWSRKIEAELRRRPIDDRTDGRNSPEWRELGSMLAEHLARYDYA